MPLLYAVRCRFTGGQAAERSWNEWYAGHLEVLMSVQGFLAAQRFVTSASPDRRPYLALYQVQDEAVFTSPQYLRVWGFSSWRDRIDNWRRDLFQAALGGSLDFATPLPDGRLRAAFLSVPSGSEEAALRRLAELRTGVRGGTVCGLDRSCSAIAWEVGGAVAGLELPSPTGMEVVQALYQPITPCLTRPC